MNNLYLFELINAPAHLGTAKLAVATFVAQWVVYFVPLTLVAAWLRGDEALRADLFQLVVAVLISLCLAQVVSRVWPQPRPFALHIGTQYLEHGVDPGLPSDHVTVFWSLGLAALTMRRLALLGLPLLAVGLLVGWSRVYLGVHFPLDIIAALPVAAAGTAITRSLRGLSTPVIARLTRALGMHVDIFLGKLRNFHKE